MMKRKRVHHNRHPFDLCPFEVYWCDAWKEVDRLRISGGHITTHVVNDGETFEADIRMSSLRLRSRKATELDCTCFLRPGVDICVFTNSYLVDNSDEEKSVETHDMENTDGEKAIESCVTDNSNGKKSVQLHIIKNLDVEQSIVTRLIDNSDGEKSLEPHHMDISEEGKSIEPLGSDNLDEDKSTENSDEEVRTDPAWVDAKIRSIKRKPHNNGCTCEFYVSFYHTQGPELVQNKLLHRDVHAVQLHQISIHQKLDLKPAESEFYRWGYSEDCSSLLKHKLFSGRFASDLSWLVVASVLKQTAFDVRSIQNKMVYEIFGDTPNSDMNECDSATSPSYAVNFKQDNELLTPHVIEFGESSPKTESSGDIVETGALVLYNPLELRRSKRRLVQPDRYLGCDDDLAEFEIDLDTIRIGAKVPSKYDEEEVPLALSVQADNGIETEDDPKDGDYSYEIRGVKKYYAHRSENKSIDSRHELHQLSKHQSRTNKSKFPLSSVRRTVQRDSNAFYQGANDLNIPDDPSVGIGDIISKYMFVTGSTLSKKRNYSNKSQAYTQKWTGSAFRIRRHRRTRSQGPVKDSIYDVRNYKKGSVSAAVYRELMKRCMVDIDASVNKEQPPIIDQWEAFKSRKFPNQNQHQEEPSMDLDEEASELDRLWKEMELALASCYLLDDHEQSQDESFGSEKGGKYCHHDYRLNEEVGVVCNLCGFVSIEIKNISPSFLPTKYYTPNKEQRHDEVKELKPSEGDDEQFKVPAPSNSASTEGESEENVWALIPSLRHKLRDHQKKAFEFLWRNVAGSIVPTEMEEKVKKRGGCVISHTPGAGKTLLIITFLVSYLKLFPGSRPLVLAPKTTLYTWYKEIIKWEIPVPVYQIHGGQTYKGEILRQKMKLNPGLPRNQDVMHVLDCLEKIQLWLSHPSILLMGYTSFMTLMREDSNYAHRKYMAQVLRQCPGILVLDEGHNPRSTKSRLRKALMKVNTKLRVLLSGTLFQNNFGEYFNTLCLARPNFVSEVLKVLDPKYKRRKKDEITRFSRENRARKYFIDKISAQINSSVPEERMEGLTLLKNLTGKFIDIYEGSNSDQLPGLQCYTLMMKSTALQQGILLKLQNQRPEYKGFPLELELLITLGAIHPWLIRTTACSSQYFSESELESLEQFKFDLKLGSKVRFVMSLIPRCLIRQEKVLIFCHNIAPINLFLDIFEKYYGWTRSEEVLVLSGEIELFERGRLIDKFEDPNGSSKVMLASINACAEGISLTAASRVILLDSEWNPSKSKQAIARAFRPGQEKVVYVYQLLATGTLEEEKYSRTTWKEWVSCMIFSEELVEDPSHWQAPKIEDELLREIVEEDRAVLFHRIMKNEKASNVIRGKSNVSYDNTPKDD